MELNYKVVLFLLNFLSAVFTLEILNSFREPSGGSSIQRIAADKTSGAVYVGAKNRLHKLSANLTLLQSASIGPRNDNPDCPPPVMPCSIHKTLMDNFVQSLVIDPNRQTLILCTTLFHGSCQTISLKNITDVKSVSRQPLVPNDVFKSTTMFLTSGSGTNQSVFIGAEYSPKGDLGYRYLVPSISRRDISTFELKNRDKTGSTKLSLLENYRNISLMFLKGFSSNGFSYFIVTHKERLGSDRIVTKFIRLCDGDNYFNSYVEVPLLCKLDNSQATSVFRMDDQLFVSFTKEGRSSLCVFSFNKLDESLNTIVDDCNAGNGNLGPAHFVKARPCVKISDTPVDKCGQHTKKGLNRIVEGVKSPAPTLAAELDDQMYTSLLVNTEDGSTFVYLGTSDGFVVKYLLGQDFKLLESIDLGVRQPVTSLLQTGQDRMLALTNSKIVSLLTDHCASRKTCSSCVDGVDPVCGWCVMEKVCSIRKACVVSPFRPSWISSTSGVCVGASDTRPNTVSYQTLAVDDKSNRKELSFELKSVSLHPSTNLDLGCMYRTGNQKHLTPASVSRHKVVTCPLPEQNKLPEIPHDHEKLSVHFHVGGRSIVERSVAVYNCDVHDTCTGCSQSTFGCQWCYSTGKCVEPLAQCTDINGQTVSGIQASDQCPHLWWSDKELLVHSGQEKRITARISNLQPGQTENVYCVFKYSGKTEKVPASISSSSLSCGAVKFSYDLKVAYEMAEFGVEWGKDGLPLDNKDDVQVRIYKCREMVTYCGQCLTMDVKYKCGFCRKTSSCSLRDECSGKFLDRQSTCPNPQITRFSPATGPVGGNTVLSISGINLGKKSSDLAVSVAGRPCIMQADKYKPSSRFVCEVSSVDKELAGNISVTVDGIYTASSDAPFVFVTPIVKTIEPKRGPKSGGSIVVVSGDHIDTGTDVVVTLGGQVCKHIRRNKTSVTCKTPAMAGTKADVNVEVNFGGSRLPLPEKFTYVSDPYITMIEPLQSVISGGTSITVHGDNFDLVQNPQFTTKYKGNTFTEECQVRSNNVLECLVPAIDPQVNVTETSPLETQYGFIMADVASVQEVSKDRKFGPMLYFPDPEVKDFDQDDRTKVFQEGDKLSIQGEFRMVNVLMSSVRVYVGEEMCDQISSTDLSITCQPPADTPKGTDDSGKAEVTVEIGNVKSMPGYLRYFFPAEESKPIAVAVILGVVLPIIFIVILLTVCVVRRHRKHKPDQNYIPDVLKDYEGKKEGEEEEMIGLENAQVKVDMNGTQMEKHSDSTTYINELLAKFDEPLLKQNVSSALVARKKLQFGDLIGKGFYGVVYKATYTDGDKQLQVAAKTIHGHRSEVEAMQQFLKSVALVRDLSHPHLLKVVGVCVSPSDDPVILMPFMATEDLCSFLRETNKVLSVAVLVQFCHQVAEALAYLESLRVAHKNLAARNCIVIEEDDKSTSIKLTDYTVANCLFPPDFYWSVNGDASELVRWMAPEAVEENVFNSQSDVWSFGIVMWEVMTRGVEPYPSVPPTEVLSTVKAGKKLPKPKQCPEQLYCVMDKCWALEPSSRPLFSTLVTDLSPFVPQDGPDNETQPLSAENVGIGEAEEYVI